MRVIGILAALAMHAGCDRPLTDTSFGVEGTSFSCAGNECEIVFYVDNQMPHSMDVRYEAVLSNNRKDVVFELSDRITLPAFEKTRVARNVRVTDEPDRLEVSVTTLQGL